MEYAFMYVGAFVLAWVGEVITAATWAVVFGLVLRRLGQL